DDDSCIQRSTAPEVPLRFGIGDTVSCKVEEGWEPGIIADVKYRDEDSYGGRIVPYEIKLDMGDTVYAPCDNDLFIRKKLRFGVDVRVDCFDDNSWIPGTVTKTWVEDDDLDNGRVVPYQVQLDTGDTYFAEKDDDAWIKQSATPKVHICRGENNGFVHVMVKMLVYNEEYDEAEDFLLERINKIRSKIKANNEEESTDDVFYWRVDMSNFLFYLAEVYHAKGLLDDMKAALDESLKLIGMTPDKSKSFRLLNVTSKLATHAALTSNKYTALAHSEEAILLAKDTSRGHDSFRLGLLMFQSGKLNIGCNNRQRGLSQMSEGLKMLTRLYGRDNKSVSLAAEELRQAVYSDDL
ncbi:hypothetical protein ACHAXR_003237, partial [Thalassiosira sp. AJA248-18]